MADVSKINGYNIKDITARNQLEKLTNRSITISAGAGTTNVGWWQVVKIAKSSISLSQNYSAVFLVNGVYGNQGQSYAEPSGIIEVDVRNNSGILTQQTVSLISGNLNAANIGISINDSDYLYLYHKVGSEYRSVTYTLISENINGATVFEPTFVSSTMPAGTAYAVNRNKAVYAETARNYETSGGTIKEKFDTHDTQINSHQVEITNIKNGTTIVGKANNANTAAAATQANNYNTSTGTIKSKFDELEEKIGSGGSLSPAGSAYRPVYIDTDGKPKEIYRADSTSAAALSSLDESLPTVRDIYYGTPTINNSKSYSEATKIYVPLSAGTAGYLLKSGGSSGSGIPVWANVNMYPSSRASFSLPSSGGSVTPTKNGYICVSKRGTAANQYLVASQSGGAEQTAVCPSNGTECSVCMPVKANTSVKITYNAAGETVRAFWVYTN